MAKYQKIADLKHGKGYRPVVSILGKPVHVSNLFFRTATMAVAYGARIEQRYLRMKAALGNDSFKNGENVVQ